MSDTSNKPKQHFLKRIRFLPSSLFLRFALLQILILLGGAVFAQQTTFYRDTFIYNQSEQSIHRHLSQKIAAEIENMSSQNYWDLQKLLLRWTTENSKIEVYILDSTGKIIADSGTDGTLGISHVRLQPLQTFLSSEGVDKLPIYSVDPRHPPDEQVFSAAKVKLQSESGYVYTILTKEAFRIRLIKSHVGILSIFALRDILICVAISSFVGSVIFFLVTSRLRQTVKVLANFHQNDYSSRINVKGPSDEIRLLMETINSMADSIDSNMTELKRKDSLRRELIASVAHDLRSPASLISGFTELMLKDQSLSKANLEYCQIVVDSCASLNRLLAELFELAKFEAKEIQPKLEPFAIDELLDEMVGTYKVTASEKGITVSTKYPESIPMVVGDCGMITRVLTNLVDNALRYTPQGGTINLGLEVAEQITVSVSDTGVGIPNDQLPHVFERFYQVKQLSGSQNGLSGLGLAIVKKIIEAHGSEIMVSSIEGMGTTFKFNLAITA